MCTPAPTPMLTVSDKLVLLTLLVALSAYLATIRLFLTDRLQKAREHNAEIPQCVRDLAAKVAALPAEQRAVLTPLLTSLPPTATSEPPSLGKTRTRLRWISIPDFLIIASAVSLGLNIFYWPDVSWLYQASEVMFTAGGAFLLTFHVIEWIRTWRHLGPHPMPGEDAYALHGASTKGGPA